MTTISDLNKFRDTLIAGHYYLGLSKASIGKMFKISEDEVTEALDRSSDNYKKRERHCDLNNSQILFLRNTEISDKWESFHKEMGDINKILATLYNLSEASIKDIVKEYNGVTQFWHAHKYSKNENKIAKQYGFSADKIKQIYKFMTEISIIRDYTIGISIEEIISDLRIPKEDVMKILKDANIELPTDKSIEVETTYRVGEQKIYFKVLEYKVTNLGNRTHTIQNTGNTLYEEADFKKAVKHWKKKKSNVLQKYVVEFIAEPPYVKTISVSKASLKYLGNSTILMFDDKDYAEI